MLPKKEEVDVDTGCGHNRSSGHKACCVRCGGFYRCYRHHGWGVKSKKEEYKKFTHDEVEVKLISGTNAV